MKFATIFKSRKITTKNRLAIVKISKMIKMLLDNCSSGGCLCLCPWTDRGTPPPPQTDRIGRHIEIFISNEWQKCPLSFLADECMSQMSPVLLH